MRFGGLTLGHSPSPDGVYAAIEEQVTQACFAEAAGFDGIWLTEHNFTGESVSCDPIPFATVVAARTSRIRIGFAVIQLALRHPIRLATQLALLDNLSDGRLDIGVGHGTNYNESEFMGYGLRSHDSRARMEETLDVLVRAWTEAPLVHRALSDEHRRPAARAHHGRDATLRRERDPAVPRVGYLSSSPESTIGSPGVKRDPSAVRGRLPAVANEMLPESLAESVDVGAVNAGAHAEKRAMARTKRARRIG